MGMNGSKAIKWEIDVCIEHGKIRSAKGDRKKVFREDEELPRLTDQ